MNSARWKNVSVWIALYWRWLVGGPNLTRELGSRVIAAACATYEAEVRERDNRREVFKSWSLVCAASDNTIIRIRPATFTLHVQGEVTQAVYDRLKLAWKESALLIRLPFPLHHVTHVVTDRERYVLVGDWTISEGLRQT